MPWRGATEPGEFPTLGHEVAAWIEANLIIPDGERQGQPFTLYDEQYMFLLRYYRLIPQSRRGDGSDAFQFHGGLLARPQKWGKDPLGAAIACIEALGPVRFAGWDANGDPVGEPWATPHVQCAGNAEEQCDNTYRPIVSMLREGPLAGTPGLDVGDTRIVLPSGGRIEPVSASARARQGARITFCSLTESQLMTESSGGLKLARTLKRNLGGMDGRWLEISNAWDPAERSVAQRTFEAKDRHVYVDMRPPRTRIDLADDDALAAEVEYVYGDSGIKRGGHVRTERIIREIRNPATGEGEARRYFLNEVTVGSKDAVDMLKWAGQARPGELLAAGERISLGFHGSQTRDATSLCAARMSDGRLFHLRTWEKPYGQVGDWQVPRDEVNQAVDDAFVGYDVACLFATPATWQDEVNAWSGKWPKRVLELWLNSEMRMDQLIERFRTAHQAGETTHDGTEVLTAHAGGAALANGKRRPSAEEREPGQADHYQRIVRKSWAQSISAFTAALLAYEARGWSMEHRTAEPVAAAPQIWLLGAGATH
jgi:hypothetical protein